MNRSPIYLAVLAVTALLIPPAGSMADPIKPGFDLLNSKKGKIKIKAGDLPGVKIPSPVTVDLKGVSFSKNPFSKKNPFFKKNPTISPKKPQFGSTNKIFERKDRVENLGSTRLKLEALSLKSRDAITLKKQDGRTGKFNMFVTLEGKSPAPKGRLNIPSHDPGIEKTNGEFTLSLPSMLLRVDLIPIDGRANNLDLIQGLVTTTAVSGVGSWGHEGSYPTIPNLPNPGGFILNPFDITDGVFALSSVLPAVAGVSEPMTLALLGTGLVLVGVGRRRRPAVA